MEMETKNSYLFEDVKVNIKIKLSALWGSLMFFYIYADILGFYTPGIIGKVAAGEIGSFQITEGFLFYMAIWMGMPSLMVVLSLMLKANLNRWLNISAGILSFVALLATFFAGEISARYIFQAIVEGILIILIIWKAWKWPKQEKALV